ncbi:phosphonate C-P lyase system protein PhnH [Enemella sp. A6]|uniref:phosphonate C-P lyase system protein PhnH n=1 Tax=Enemella sp. A6 TaxID=3440152 RepID=UPI003EBAE6AD
MSPRVLTADECQQVFRILLDALARPGQPGHLPEIGDPLDLPLLALTDLTTPVAALDPTEEEQACTEAVVALTQAPLTAADSARFVISHREPDPAAFASLHRGSNERPHEAALLIQAAMIAEQPQPDFDTWELTGPGIADSTQVHLAGLDRDFFAVREQLVADYPRGVDVLLIDPIGTVLGLPRTTTITEVTP